MEDRCGGLGLNFDHHTIFYNRLSIPLMRLRIVWPFQKHNPISQDDPFQAPEHPGAFLVSRFERTRRVHCDFFPFLESLLQFLFALVVWMDVHIKPLY